MAEIVFTVGSLIIILGMMFGLAYLCWDDMRLISIGMISTLIVIILTICIAGIKA